jgi:uncharacterized protein YndB with AHSA1/START domain
MMPITDLTRIDRSIDISAAPDRVFDALTSAAEVATWFRMKVEGEMVQGGDVWMTAGPEYGSLRFPVKIVELSRPRRVVWQWHPGAVAVDYGREPMTTVTFTLEPTPTGTRVTVSETGFDAISLERRAKAHAENTQGWTEVIVWIKDHVEKKG